MLRLFGFGGDKEPHFNNSASNDGKPSKPVKNTKTLGPCKTQIKNAKKEIELRKLEKTVNSMQANLVVCQNEIDESLSRIKLLDKEIEANEKSLEEWDEMIAECLRIRDENNDPTPPEGQKV